MSGNDIQPSYPILLEAIDAAYAKYTGAGIGISSCPFEIAQGSREVRLSWVDSSAPFGLLAHNTESDPKFIYGNNAALEMFGYRREELIGLPSRLSAAPDRRPARAAFLETVRACGIADNYADVRVDHQGRPFRIRDGIVWQFYDDRGAVAGQAALIWFDGRAD